MNSYEMWVIDEMWAIAEARFGRLLKLSNLTQEEQDEKIKQMEAAKLEMKRNG